MSHGSHGLTDDEVESLRDALAEPFDPTPTMTPMPESPVTFATDAEACEVADGEHRIVFEPDGTFTTSDPGMIALLDHLGFDKRAATGKPTVLKEK